MQRVDFHTLHLEAEEELIQGASLGETLRNERARRGVTLRELHQVTKIKEEILWALEEDRHDLLPAPIFVRGFIKAICQYLDLPAGKIIQTYNREGPPMPAKVMTNPLLIPEPTWWMRIWRWLKRVIIGANKTG